MRGISVPPKKRKKKGFPNIDKRTYFKSFFGTNIKNKTKQKNNNNKKQMVCHSFEKHRE